MDDRDWYLLRRDAMVILSTNIRRSGRSGFDRILRLLPLLTHSTLPRRSAGDRCGGLPSAPM
jgi:hypothetical protein